MRMETQLLAECISLRTRWRSHLTSNDSEQPQSKGSSSISKGQLKMHIRLSTPLLMWISLEEVKQVHGFRTAHQEEKSQVAHILFGLLARLQSQRTAILTSWSIMIGSQLTTLCSERQLKYSRKPMKLTTAVLFLTSERISINQMLGSTLSLHSTARLTDLPLKT